nr:MAG TPA: hypothetical protein [Bacteriophage sp.]
MSIRGICCPLQYSDTVDLLTFNSFAMSVCLSPLSFMRRQRFSAKIFLS